MLLARLERWFRRVLIFGLAVLLVETASAASARPPDASGEISAQLDAVTQTQVSWPPSSTFVVGEVVTRAAAAADQYAEIYNSSAGPVDLAGLELVYVTASGLTVTRKQTWTSLVVPAHAHVLVANASGVYAAQADGLFSNGGFSTTGGTLVLRFVTG